MDSSSTAERSDHLTVTWSCPELDLFQVRLSVSGRAASGAQNWAQGIFFNTAILSQLNTMVFAANDTVSVFK